jgi:dolichol-phosphate mannosyltransferase
MGQFGSKRVFLSRLGQKVSRTVCQCELTDPMSGFFIVNRAFFSEVVHQLHGGGFKILVDMISSAKRPVRFAELGYTFRARRFGESKLDAGIAVDYLLLVIDKLTGQVIPLRFAAFSLVGATGVATHFAVLGMLYFLFHRSFIEAQIVATYVAMTENFFLNNLVTWRDRSLRGFRLVSGLASFWLACSFGAWANVIFARSLLQSGAPWYMAGIAGIVLGSVWNYCICNLFTWKRRRSSDAVDAVEAAECATDLSR